MSREKAAICLNQLSGTVLSGCEENARGISKRKREALIRISESTMDELKAVLLAENPEDED